MVLLVSLLIASLHATPCHQLIPTLQDLESQVVTTSSRHGLSLTSEADQGFRAMRLVQQIRGPKLEKSYHQVAAAHHEILIPVVETWFREVEAHLQSPKGESQQVQEKLSGFRKEKFLALQGELAEARRDRSLTLDRYNRLILFALILTAPTRLADSKNDVDLATVDRSISLYNVLEQSLVKKSDHILQPAFYGTAFAREIVEFVGRNIFLEHNFILMPVRKADVGILPLSLMTTLGTVPISMNTPSVDSAFRYAMHDMYHFFRNVDQVGNGSTLFVRFSERLAAWKRGDLSSLDLALDAIAINMYGFELWIEGRRHTYFAKELRAFEGGAPIFAAFEKNEETLLDDLRVRYEALSGTQVKR